MGDTPEGENVVDTQPQGEEGALPNHSPPEDPQDFPDVSSLIPKEYQSKPWVQDIKDVPSLFKIVEDSKAAASRRPAGIPQEDAPAEQWQEFNKAFGVPEKSDEYSFDDVPEELRDQGFEKGVRKVLHEAGVSKKQFESLKPLWNDLVKEQQETRAKALDEQFDKLLTETFGDQADQVLDQTNKLVAKYVPDNLKGHLDNMPNESQIVLASLVKGLQKDFISEDALPEDSGGPPPNSQESRQKEGMRLMQTKEYQDPFHADHEKTVRKVRELFGTL